MEYIQYVPLICDAVLILSFITVIGIMAKRGFIRSLYKLVSLAATIIIVAAVSQPVSQVLSDSQVGAVIYRNINQVIMQGEQQRLESGDTTGSMDFESIWDMPTYIKASSDIKRLKDGIASNAAQTITNMVIRLITSILLFVLIRFIIMIIFSIVDILFKLPVLGNINKLVGIFAGFFNVCAVVYIICAVISLNAGVFDAAKDIIEKTYILKYFYNYNILMNLFI